MFNCGFFAATCCPCHHRVCRPGRIWILNELHRNNRRRALNGEGPAYPLLVGTSKGTGVLGCCCRAEDIDGGVGGGAVASACCTGNHTRVSRRWGRCNIYIIARAGGYPQITRLGGGVARRVAVRAAVIGSFAGDAGGTAYSVSDVGALLATTGR